MKTKTHTLPDDPQTLQQMVLQMQEKLAQKDTLILTLQQQLLVLRRRQFGRSSEQVEKQIHQIELQLEELEIQAAQTADVALPGTDWRAPIDSHSQLRDNYLNWSVYENAKKLFKRIQTGRC